MVAVRLERGSCMLEADRCLLKYYSYNDYLDDLINPDDVRNMRSLRMARKIAELGFKIAGDTLTKKEFEKRRKKLDHVEHPKYSVPQSISKFVTLGRDPLIEAVAYRERPCRVGILQTIVFIRVVRGNGKETSAFIDLVERFKKSKMLDFFRGKKRLIPFPSDLAYFDWSTKTLKFNETLQFEIVGRSLTGSVFRSRVDNLILDPSLPDPGVNSYREDLQSANYNQCTVFDHVVRNRGMHF